MFNSYPEGRVLFVVLFFFPQYVYHHHRHSLFLFSLPSGHLQVFPGGRIMSAVSTQQSLHHRGCHTLRLSQRLLPRWHGQTGGHVHQWVTLPFSCVITVSLRVINASAKATFWTSSKPTYYRASYRAVQYLLIELKASTASDLLFQTLILCILFRVSFAAMFLSLFGDLGSSK